MRQVSRFLSSLSDIRFWTGWKTLAVTVRTVLHILSEAPLVVPDERWCHIGPLSCGVIVLIDLLTNKLLGCCSLFCLPAFLAWCNWQRLYWSGNYCNLGWGGVGLGNPSVCAVSRQHENQSVLPDWLALPLPRKLNHAASTHPPSTGYPGNIRKSIEFTENMSKLIPASLHLNYLFISVSIHLLVHLSIDFGLEYSEPSSVEKRTV